MSVVYLHIYIYGYIYVWYNKTYYITITIIYLYDPWVNIRTKKINATGKQVPRRPWKILTVSLAETNTFEGWIGWIAR